MISQKDFANVLSQDKSLSNDLIYESLDFINSLIKQYDNQNGFLFSELFEAQNMCSYGNLKPELTAVFLSLVHLKVITIERKFLNGQEQFFCIVTSKLPKK